MDFVTFARGGASVTDRSNYDRNNVAGALVRLEAARIARFMFSSTCATYEAVIAMAWAWHQRRAVDRLSKTMAIA